MMPSWTFRYPSDHYQRRPHHLITTMTTALSAQFPLHPNPTG